MQIQKTVIMKKNMGSVDIVTRLVLAAIFLVMYFTQDLPGAEGIIMLILSITFVLTSIFNFCPLYTILGFNTCAVKKG